MQITRFAEFFHVKNSNFDFYSNVLTILLHPEKNDRVGRDQGRHFLQTLMKNWLAILLFPFCAFAQAPGIAWQRLIGGNHNDGIRGIVATPNDGCLLTGGSLSGISGDKTMAQFGFGGSDIWIVKLDANRNIQWQNQYGGVGSTDGLTDYGVATLPTYGGYLVAGGSNTPVSGNKTEYCRGGLDYWLIKTDETGNPVWQKAYGGSADDYLRNMVATSDGNFVLAGYSLSSASGEKTEDSRGGSDGWVIKIDPQGNILWQLTIGGSDKDQLLSAGATPDGGVVLGFSSRSPISGEKSENSYGFDDYWIVKLNAAGSIEWQKTIGGNEADYLTFITRTSDNGYFVCGTSYSVLSGLKTQPAYGGGDFWGLKLDINGNILWQKSIGGNDSDDLQSAIETSDSGFILAGNTFSDISGNKTVGNYGGADNTYDTWLVRLGPDGDILWQKDIGGLGDEFGFQMFRSEDNGVVLGGISGSSNSGNIDQTSNGERDYWLLKLEPEALGTQTFLGATVFVWPNPTEDVVNIRFSSVPEKMTVSVYDMTGRLVSVGEYENVSSVEKLALGNAAGLYLVKVDVPDGQGIFKILKR